MTENAPLPTEPSTAGAGIPFYEKQRQQLTAMITKRRLLERALANIEDSIAKKENEYLEDTPNGNIITGFENYTKGTSTISGAGQRRRGQVQEANRVFSRSSVSYNGNAVSRLFFVVLVGDMGSCSW
jgi:chromatin modification-related protein EAF6